MLFRPQNAERFEHLIPALFLRRYSCRKGFLCCREVNTKQMWVEIFWGGESCTKTTDLFQGTSLHPLIVVAFFSFLFFSSFGLQCSAWGVRWRWLHTTWLGVGLLHCLLSFFWGGRYSIILRSTWKPLSIYAHLSIFIYLGVISIATCISMNTNTKKREFISPFILVVDSFITAKTIMMLKLIQSLLTSYMWRVTHEI